MKHSHLSSSRRLAVLAAAFGFALMAAPVAHAFTFDNQTTTNGDGSAKYVDPDARLSPSGSGGQTSIRQGNATFQFGPAQQPFNQRYNSNNLFDPVGRPMGER
jgi:hypothetical protein